MTDGMFTAYEGRGMAFARFGCGFSDGIGRILFFCCCHERADCTSVEHLYQGLRRSVLSSPYRHVELSAKSMLTSHVNE
jgi:hypothetical protein